MEMDWESPYTSLGIAFFIPALKLAFQYAQPLNIPSEFIFFSEALVVYSIFHYVASNQFSASCLVIYTDNTNTVDIFNSLHAIAPYNQILISAVILF
jgi:hypothetical protein